MKELMLNTAQELSDEQAGGHGNRWGVFEGGTDAVMRWLPTIVEKAEMLDADIVDKADIEAVIAAGEPNGALLLYTGKEKGTSMTGAMALIHMDPGGPGRKPANEFWSAYPIFGDGVEVHGVVERLRPHPNRLEGRLEVSLSTGSLIFPFDPLFCLHRALYREGETYRFSVSALAYSMGPTQQIEHVIDDPDEIRLFHARNAWAKEHGECLEKDFEAALGAWKPESPEDMEPIRIDMSRMTMLMPSTEGPADDASYSGKVVSVSPDAVRMLDTSFWRVDVTLIRPEEDVTVTLPLYVTENLFEGEWRPSVGEYVTGHLWLQAYAKGPMHH